MTAKKLSAKKEYLRGIAAFHAVFNEACRDSTTQDRVVLTYVRPKVMHDLVVLLVKKLVKASNSDEHCSVGLEEFLNGQELHEVLGVNVTDYLVDAWELGGGSHVWLADAIAQEVMAQYQASSLTVYPTTGSVVFGIGYYDTEDEPNK